MAELKREYVVPLRAKTRNAPKWRRSKKAVSVLREFIIKHMKTDNVIVCPELNELIWENGIKNPPGKVSVIAQKIQVGNVEKTIVNLASIGVDKYLDAYRAQSMQVEEKQEETKQKVVEETLEEETITEEKEARKKKAKKEEAVKDE